MTTEDAKSPTLAHDNTQLSDLAVAGTSVDLSEYDPATGATLPSADALRPPGPGQVRTGQVLAGKYELVSVLGAGGMGKVWKGMHLGLGVPIAVKIMHPEIAASKDYVRRFRREAHAASILNHPNAVRVLDFGDDDGTLYMVMEFLAGESVTAWLGAMDGPPALSDVAEIMGMLLDAFSVAHAYGIVHRDLKPDNVFLTEVGGKRVVKVVDFGLAHVEDTRDQGPTLTAKDVIAGTPEYMSPEQCLGEKLDHRSDIYALGIVIYEMFAGNVPFRGDTPVATLFKHIQDPVPFEGALAAHIPLAAVPVLRRALAKNRADRFSSASAAADALRRAQQQMLSGSVAGDATPTAGMAKVGPAGSGAHTAAGPDRRRVTRLDIFVNFVLRRVGTLGTVLQEERTIAENMGRGGARVMTTMASLAPGDIVHLEEVGGPFKTRAEVRGRYVGQDGIRRLNLRFLDSPAPDYLVYVDDGSRR